MRTASYRHGVEWIALNDGVGDAMPGDPDALLTLEAQVTVTFLADLFDVETLKVAKDVLARRRKAVKEGDLN